MKKCRSLLILVLMLPAACRRDTEGTTSSPPSAAPPPAQSLAPQRPASRRFAGYPPTEGACVADGDCQLAGKLRTDPGLTGCCLQCNEFETGTKAWALAAINACIASGPCSEPLNCPQTSINPFMAMCEQGKCVVRHNPAVWNERK